MVSKTIQIKFEEEQKKIISSKLWQKFIKSYKKIESAATNVLPFDPKFNSILWAFDIVHLVSEVAFSYCWMTSYADHYKKNIIPNSQPSHSDFHVIYFADNSITRINSCRDKIALMIWAYYCPFHPEKKEEILNFHQISDRFRNPHKYCLRLNNHKIFLNQLLKLESKSFKRINEIRHLKIHRREPSFEIFGVKSFHDWGYMLPLSDDSELKKFDKQLKIQYPDFEMQKVIKENCMIDGILYDRIRLTKHLLDFCEIEEKIYNCFCALLSATSECFMTFRRRSPLRNKNN